MKTYEDEENLFIMVKKTYESEENLWRLRKLMKDKKTNEG